MCPGGALGARARLSPHRHRAGLRQRGKRRAGAARERRPAGRGVHHHQVPSLAQGPGCRSRAQPRTAGGRQGRPLHHPLAAGWTDVGVAGNGTGSRARARTLDRSLQLQRCRAKGAAGGGARPTGRQPGAIQPLRVPEASPRRVSGERRRTGGLQPAGTAVTSGAKPQRALPSASGARPRKCCSAGASSARSR